MRFTLLDDFSKWTLSFQIFFWERCHVPLENLTACFDPNFPSFRRVDFLGKESLDTQHDCTDSFNKATDPFHHFSATLYFAAHHPQCVRTVTGRRMCIPIRFVILTYERKSIITRRIRTSSFDDFFARSLTFPSRKGYFLWDCYFKKAFIRQSVSALLEPVRMFVPFGPRYRMRG